MKMIIAFARGMFEFRQSVTTHFERTELEAYDAGREIAHKLTFRLFEN
jgi:hypothetical protein